MTEETNPTTSPELPPAGTLRTLIGGVLMGIANIIPGVSGGTMLLATGIYEHFVESVADITRLRWRLRSWVFVGLLATAAIVAIAASVFPIGWGLDHHHHIMFSLFIGLTLGGVPLLWRELKPVRPSAITSCVIGIVVMAVISFALSSTSLPVNWVTYLIAGFIASAAMVLPGISGSYLLLIFGLYAPLTTAIKDFIHLLKAMDISGAFAIGTSVILPIGIGIVLGIGGLTNVLKLLLQRFHQATLGFLMGLLIGSVLGLYPFKALVEKGVERAPAHEINALSIAMVVIAALIGFGITFVVSRMGKE